MITSNGEVPLPVTGGVMKGANRSQQTAICLVNGDIDLEHKGPDGHLRATIYGIGNTLYVRMHNDDGESQTATFTRL